MRRRRKSGLAAAGGCLAAYVVLAVAFHWLMRPVVGKNFAAVAYEPPVATFASRFDALSEAPARAALPARAASGPAISTAAAASAPDTAVAPKKAPKKHVARTRPPAPLPQDQWVRGHQNQQTPWDFASRGFFGNRPWF